MPSSPANIPWDVFISHASEDVDTAYRLCAELESAGRRVFLAARDLPKTLGSADWSERIDQALDDSQILVLLASPEALSKKWVTYEWRSFHDDILSDRGGWLIPCCTRDLAPNELGRALRRYQVVDVRTEENWGGGVRQVLDLVEGHLLEAENPGENSSGRSVVNRKDEELSVPAAPLPYIEPVMVTIPAGRFWMGTENGGFGAERPFHEVRIAQPFALGIHAVTFAEYDWFVESQNRGDQPSDFGWGRDDRPVIDVSWEDAQAYAEWLSKLSGMQYRLPTEAEWEYAARAGSTTAYWWGDDIGKNRANCESSGSEWSGSRTAPVGQFDANDFGLHDTVGNVWEWVQDCWHKNYDGAPVDGSAWLEGQGGDCSRRVLRGGSWGLKPESARSAARLNNDRDLRFGNVGFRLARTLDP